MIKRFFGNKTAKNAGWIIGGKIAQMLVNLLVGLLTARYLGPSNYGLINYAAAYTAFFAAFCTLGINSVLVKEFIDYPGEEGKIIGTALGVRAISSFLSALVIVCIVSIADAGDRTTIAVVALSSIGMIFHVFEVINPWFQSRLQSKVTAVVSLIAYAATAVYKVVLLVLGKDVTWFAFATSVDYICVGLLLMVAYKKHNGGRLTFSAEYGRDILRRSCHFILPALMVSIYGQTDKIMLKHMFGDAEIGFYSTAVSLSSVWCFVLAAIIDSIYPSIMQANRVDEQLFIKRNKQLYAIVFYISVFVSLCFVIFGKLAVLIMYGEAYLPAVAPLKIITWYTAFSYLGVARNAWIVSKNRQKHLIFVYAAAALSNVLLNLMFIPVWGASGAAAASLAAQIVTTMVAPFFIKDLRENSKMMVDAILLRGIRG